uniref:hypothetical protein n=1 Tax=Thaumasiovibrio occultus TaxID=1891184 RepID=UPI000B34E527|nr:hypothetical protein [Thaumasiovibrio occultus]
MMNNLRQYLENSSRCVKSLFLVLVAISTLSGCARNMYLAQSEREDMIDFNGDTAREKVYVTNPEEFPSEYELLLAADIFQFVAESQTNIRLTLEAPTSAQYSGMMMEVFFLHLIPHYTWHEQTLNYQLEQDGMVTPYRHWVSMTERYSVWETFFIPFTKTREELIIEGIRHNPRQERIEPLYFE